MKIDRERYLVLAAAIATATVAEGATGCSSTQTPPPEEPHAGTPAATTAAAPVSVYVYVLPAAPPAGTTASEPVITSAPVPAAPAPPPPPVAPIASPAPTSADPYKGTPVTAQTCSPALNSVGAPRACALTAPGPTCESFADTKQECPTLNRLLKPRVAAAAIECLRRKSGSKEICEFNISSICAYEALGSACLDPSAKAVCNKVVARCGPPHGHYNKMTRESCEAGVSGIADAKRAKFISCISESCRFETCLTYL